MKYFLISFTAFFFSFGFAEEGMLIPSLLNAFESDMQAKGMKLTADQIYSVNHSSLKDAIMHFNGGCTAEMVSSKGLMLTNHHCGLSNVQSHSTKEKDYLKNGFWAKNYSEELRNQNLTATRIVRIEDVSALIRFGTEGLEDGNKIYEIMQRNRKKIIDDAILNSHYKADIQAFDYGNSYYLMVKEVFLDVRLVGTPPSFIGKFGGDTDNWVWPRHTGDFTVFRIYAGVDGKPAPISDANVPYSPIQFLKIAFNDRKSGDFTMVYGFPGQTEQHLSSGYLKYIVEKQRPMEIEMRTRSLEIIDKSIRSSDELRIKYMAKQARLANSWKKNIGQIEGLKQLNAIGLKEIFEKEYVRRAESKEEWKQFANLINRMNQLTIERSDYDYHATLFGEYLSAGPEYFKLCKNLYDFEVNAEKYKNEEELKKRLELLIKSADNFYKDYDFATDKAIFEVLTKTFSTYLSAKFPVVGINNPKLSQLIYTKSIFSSKEKYVSFLKKFTSKSMKKMLKDPGYLHYKNLINAFKNNGIEEQAGLFDAEMNALLGEFVKGKLLMFPDIKHWSDANSTLRLTYGKLEGSAPTDGMAYTEHTTLKGMIDKFNTGNPDFELEPRMLELYNSKNYGNYAQNGELWVCFTGSNHTTGGNSGSPVLDANGNLMGLNFDRTWESTMSDFYFDPKRCRNVVVDIRYVMWVMDVYCGAKHLVDEMEMVK